MEQGEDKKTGGEGHLFWGSIFVILGFLALMREYVVIAGIPVWGAAFFLLGISHLMRAPSILSRLAPGPAREAPVRRVAGVIYVIAIALLAFSVISML